MTEAMLGRLQEEREHLVATLDGLSDYDVRRPMTPSGTSLLGLVKHVASVELGYLCDCVGRAHGLDAPATVSWWSADQQHTTLGHLVVRMLAETAHHAGHAETVRQQIVNG